MSRELNLLPPIRRRALFRQALQVKVNRLISHLVLSLVVLTLIGVTSIIVIRLFILTSSESHAQQLEQAIEEYQSLRGRVAEQNALLSTMDVLSEERVVWSEYVQDVLPIMPPGVQLKEIGASVLGKRQISLDGTAATRNTVIILEGRLKTLEWVREIESPHTNLLQRENTDFQFGLILPPATASEDDAQ